MSSDQTHHDPPYAGRSRRGSPELWIVGLATLLGAGIQVATSSVGVRSVALIVLSGGTAACAALAASRTAGRIRLAWALIALGMLSNTIGDGFFQVLLHRQGLVPDVSVADGFYLGTYPFLFAGMGLLAWTIGGRARARAMSADSAAIVVVAGLAIWQFFVVNPGVLEEDSLLQAIVFATYPMADVLLIGAMAALLFSVTRAVAAITYLIVFAVAFLAADIFYVSVELVGAEHLVPASDALYCLAYGLLAVAAVHPSARLLDRDMAQRDDAATSHSRLALLGAVVFTVPTMAITVPALGYAYNPVVYLVVALVVTGLVIGRVLSLVKRLVSEQRRLTDAESQLVHQAEHDSLTTLPNRAKLLAHIDGLLDAGDVHDLKVMFVDLDNFKFVNDHFGHRVGDELLSQASRRIRDAVRHENLVARIGGDEFVVVANTPGSAEVLGQRIITALTEPYELGGIVASAGGSVGIAPFAGHVDASSLIRDADLALYRAKGDGGGCVRMFDASMREWAEERIAIEAGLRDALATGGLTVAYQPRIDLLNGQMTSVEALLRWPDRPDVSIARIIEVAESSGLISAVGQYVLRQACKDIAALNAARGSTDALSVAVNVSLLQLSQHDLETDTKMSLAESRLPAEYLILELTETFLADDPDAAKRTLEALSALGVRLEIDDFGTGYSSLARLASFPLTGLKIDRSFVTAVDNDPTSRSLIESIVTLARALDLEVTAEGIETDGEADVIRDVGCDLAQGFLYAKPMTIDDLRTFTPSAAAAGRRDDLTRPG